MEIDSAGNVYARFGGTRQPHASTRNKPLIVSAHLDTVFPASVDLSIRREPERILAPGIGDNSLGVAGLFGLVWALRERGLSLPGDLWLVANVCEEGLGNLRGMQAVVDRFGPAPLAYIVVEGMALGQVYQRGLGVRRYRLSVQTAGGHSWIDYGQPSAIHELAALSTRITALELPRQPRTTLNVGVISGGSSVNTIAAEAMLELDLRSENAGTLEELVGQVEQIVRSVQKPGVAVQLEIIGQRPIGRTPGRAPAGETGPGLPAQRGHRSASEHRFHRRQPAAQSRSSRHNDRPDHRRQVAYGARIYKHCSTRKGSGATGEAGKPGLGIKPSAKSSLHVLNYGITELRAFDFGCAIHQAGEIIRDESWH